MTIKIDASILQILLLFGSLYILLFLSYISAFSFARWRDRVRRQEMIDEFLDDMSKKVRTDNDFGDIVKRWRKDFGDEAGV